MQRVFLSYRHESAEHAAAVAGLGERLRAEGVEVVLDQFAQREEFNGGGPPQGWPAWCERQAGSGKVLVVASGGWFDAWEGGGPPDAGLGAATEAWVLRQRIYDAKLLNSEIRLVSLPSLPSCDVPLALRGWQSFVLDADFAGLTTWLRAPLSGAVDWPEEPPSLEWSIADHLEVREAIGRLLTREASARLVLLEGGSASGKSTVTKEIEAAARAHAWMRVGRFDCKGAGDVDGEVALLAGELGVSAPVSGGRRGLSAVLESLRRAPRPTLLVVDTVEAIGALEEWLTRGLLVELARSPWLRVVLAGQRFPVIRVDAKRIPLLPPRPEDWLVYARGRRPEMHLDLVWVAGLLRACEGDLTMIAQVLGGRAR